jgi:hypothetical protein
VNVDPTPYPEAEAQKANNTKSVLLNLENPDQVIGIVSSDVNVTGPTLLDPAMEFSIEANIIRSGESSMLQWDTIYDFDMACTIEGPTTFATNGRYEFNPAVDGKQGSASTGPLIHAQNFIMTCTEPLTSSTFTANARVNVAGVIIER